MKLSEEAKITARFLADALGKKQIERRFSLYVIRNRGRSDHIKPGDGILDSSFRIPISALASFLELQESGLLALTDESTPNRNIRWEVWLRQEFLNFVTSEFGEDRNQIGASSQPRIFIGYSSQDNRLKGELEIELEKTHRNIWSDRAFLGGERIWSEILEKIAKCDIFVYLLSPDSIQSFACRAELSEAMRWDKQIIPLLIRPARVPTYVQTKYNLIDATKEEIHQIGFRLSTAINNMASNLMTQSPSEPLWRKPESQLVEASRVLVSVLVPARIEPKPEYKEQLNTGIMVLPGDTIEISATGKITNDILNSQPRTWITADGIDQWGNCSKEHQAYWSQYCIGSLIAWVNGISEYNLSAAFVVGRSCTKTLAASEPPGFLYMAINDSIDQYGDNDKEFFVSITVSRN